MCRGVHAHVQELDEALDEAGEAKAVVVFSALTWCRPCKGMQRPAYKLAERWDPGHGHAHTHAQARRYTHTHTHMHTYTHALAVFWDVLTQTWLLGFDGFPHVSNMPARLLLLARTPHSCWGCTALHWAALHELL